MFFTKKHSPELISLHIPKTAGTSFRNILKGVYGEDQVVRFDINEKGIIRINEREYHDKKLPAVKVIHGHFAYKSLTDKFALPENYKLITWMRDPVKRVTSNFYYLESRLKELLDEERNNLNILSKMQRSLIEYARAETNRNRQSKFLVGSQLTDFDFIGINEYFNEELERLAIILNWQKSPEVLFQNKTVKAETEISSTMYDEIASLNKIDIALYEEVLKIRNSYISKGK